MIPTRTWAEPGKRSVEELDAHLAEDRAGALWRGRRGLHLREFRAPVGLHPALSQPVLRLWVCLWRTADAEPLRAAAAAGARFRAAVSGSAAFGINERRGGSARAVRAGSQERSILEGWNHREPGGADRRGRAALAQHRRDAIKATTPLSAENAAGNLPYLSARRCLRREKAVPGQSSF